jgi:adiponectin receptor
MVCCRWSADLEIKKWPLNRRMGRKLSSHHLHKRPDAAVTNDELPLYHISEIPEWMADNRFILHGYRAGYTLKMCLRSLLTLHNETMNVWTHLVGFFFFAAFGITMFRDVLSPVFTHYVIFALMTLSCMACLCCSTIFHLFSAHYNEQACRRLHTLDYFGITCLVIGSFVPICFLAFACEPQLKWMYLTMISVLGFVGLVGPFYSFWTTPEFATYKMLVYVVLVGSGVFPIIHVNFIMPPSSSAPFATGLALEIFLYLTGMLIYIFKAPERWFPGRFDVWLHSHQVWHVFVLLAAMVHFFTTAGMYMHWEEMEHHC